MNRNDLEKRFNHKVMQELMSYLLSCNCESQTVAVDGANAENIQTTGGKAAFINGIAYVLAADAELDISAQPAYADWAVSTSYVTGLVGGTSVSEVVVDGRHFVCISAHTSYAYLHTSSSYVEADSNEPLHGATWRTYWRELDVWAIDGTGSSVGTASYIGWYLVCAMADGQLKVFEAFDRTASTYGTSTPIRIPAFDPTRYVAVGLMKITSAGTYVCGTTSTAGIVTFYQILGPIFPDLNTIDKN